MSRAQQTAVFNKTNDEADKNFDNSQNAYKAAQEDIGNYEGQLAKYAASNPYTKGGEYETSTNQVLADTAGGISDSMRSALQSQAARTGMNVAGANATAEAIADQAERNLGAQQAGAQRERIASEAGYNRDVLGATAEPVRMESNLYGESAGASDRERGIQEEAARTPSFWDTVGSKFGESLGQFMGSGGNFSWSKKA